MSFAVFSFIKQLLNPVEESVSRHVLNQTHALLDGLSRLTLRWILRGTVSHHVLKNARRKPKPRILASATGETGLGAVENAGLVCKRLLSRRCTHEHSPA